MKIAIYPCNAPVFTRCIPLKALPVEKNDSFPEISRACQKSGKAIGMIRWSFPDWNDGHFTSRSEDT